jgi:hypothetical protein
MLVIDLVIFECYSLSSYLNANPFRSKGIYFTLNLSYIQLKLLEKYFYNIKNIFKAYFMDAADVENVNNN